MRKAILIISFILSSLTYGSQSYFVGGNIGSLETKSLSGNGEINSNSAGYEFGFSWDKMVLRDFYYELELGFGAKYQSSIVSNDFLKDSYVNTIPVYLNGRFTTKLENVNYFIEGQIGYTFIDEGVVIDDLESYFSENIKVKGQLYTGIEAGIEFSDFYLALNYSITNFKREKTTHLEEETYKYIKPSLNFGVRF